MKKILKSPVTFFFCVLLLSCNKYLGDRINSFTYDAEAQKFIDSAGITDSAQKTSHQYFRSAIEGFFIVEQVYGNISHGWWHGGYH